MLILKRFTPGRTAFGLFCSAVTLLLAVSLFNPPYAVDLGRTFFNAESYEGFLMAHGISFWNAFATACACSTCDILFWFCLFASVKNNSAKLQTLYERLLGDDARKKIETNRHLVQVYRTGAWIYKILVPQAVRTLSNPERERFKKNWLNYLRLAVYGFIPGMIWPGIGYSLKAEMYPFAAFMVLAQGNILKMLACIYLSVIVGRWLALLMVICFSVIRYGLDRRSQSSVVIVPVIASLEQEGTVE